MKNHLRLLVLAICLCCSAALAGDAWFGGGGYDGYDRKGLPVAIGNPVVNNAGGATNVTTNSAWLNGMLLATGSAPSTVYVYWGPTDGVTNKANWANTNSFGDGVEGQTFTTNVSVNPNVTYSYRFYATNTAGEDGWANASASFLTPSVPALDSGSGASPLSYTTATLNGNLTAGISATVKVYWGSNSNAWSGTNSLGLRNVGAFLTTVSALSPGTLYYYRCYGTNAYGYGWSDTRAFTALVQTVVFAGGGYDGYDRKGLSAPIGVPVVNNASGATNYTATNAWLNGMLLSTGSAPTTVYVYWGPADGATNKGNWANTNNFGEGIEGQTFTTNVSLSAGLTYFYRFYAMVSSATWR